MEKNFSHYYLPPAKDFPKLWENCLFVLDTNILLNLYRFPQEARKDLLHILSKISDRIWIPFQVALEFQENRLSVIAEQKNSYNEVKGKINNAIKQLETDIVGLQLNKRHSLINPDTFLQKIKRLTTDFIEELDALDKKQSDVSDKDSLRDEIDNLFINKIGNPPTKEELDSIYKEGKIRHELKRSPGYKDIGKSEENRKAYFFGDLVLKREFGDLLIWKEIIKKGKEGNKYIIFVTDDGKEDWWQIIRGKTVGVKPELLKEIADEANVLMFYMYNSEQFMKYAKEYLRVKINDNSLNQVRDIVNFYAFEQFNLQLREPIIRWLVSLHSRGLVSYVKSPGQTIFSAEEDGKKFLYRIFYLMDLVSQETQDLLNFVANSGSLHFENFEIIIVAKTETIAREISGMLMSRKHNLSITVGTLEYEKVLGSYIFEPLRKQK